MSKIEPGLTVAGTGHRPEKLGGYETWAYNALVVTAMTVLHSLKPGKVISGMALGWDQALAEAALRMGVPFTAAIPFKGQESRWPKESQERYRWLLGKADEVVDTSEGQPYHPRLMQVRNEWMVDNCDLLVALFDGTPGGTANCVKYAKRVGRPVRNYYRTWQVTFERHCERLELDAAEELARNARAAEEKALQKLDAFRKRPIPAGRGTITVVRKGTPPAPGAIRVYVGRGSPLGNPFTHKDGTKAPTKVGSRAEAVQAYAAYLKEKLAQKDERIRKALNEIALAAMRGQRVELECYCAPHACHADVLAQLVAERMNQRTATG